MLEKSKKNFRLIDFNTGNKYADGGEFGIATVESGIPDGWTVNIIISYILSFTNLS